MSSNPYQIDKDPFIFGHVGHSLRYAICGEALTHVSQVPSGKGNGTLRCPECGEGLLAKKGSKRVHHFAHLTSTAAEGCGIESAAHLKAKEILLNAGWVYGRPIVDYWTFDDFPFESGWQVELLPAGKIFFSSAASEVSAGSRRVDVMAFRPTGGNDAILGHQMAIEVCVTHKVDQSKQSDLVDLGIPTLEIFLDTRAPIRESEFRNHVLRDAKRTWKVNPPTDTQRMEAEKAYNKRLQQLQTERERQKAINDAIGDFQARAHRVGQNALLMFGPEAVERLHDATLVALEDLTEDPCSVDAIDEHFEAKRLTDEFQNCAPDWDAKEEFYNVWGYLLCARLIGEGRIREQSQRSAALFNDLRNEFEGLGVKLSPKNELGYDLSSTSDWNRFFEFDPILAQANSSILVRALIGMNVHEALGEFDDSHYIRKVPTWIKPTGLEVSVATGLNRGNLSRKEVGRFMEGQHLAKKILRDEVIRDACRKLLTKIWGKRSSLSFRLNLSERESIGSQCIMLVQKIFQLDEGVFPPQSRDLAINSLRKTWRIA